MTYQIQHLIGGDPVGTSDVARHNPARPDDLVALTPAGDAAVVADAVSAAQAAQPGWAATPPPARGTILLDAAELLRSRADTVARDLTREEGKTLAEAHGEVRRAVDVLRYFGGEGWRLAGQQLPSAQPDTFVYTKREPLGVAALITPWNFPIAIPAWKLAPALISGNAVVLKPAELTPVSAWHLQSVLIEAGLPAGVLNIVYGEGDVVGDALVTHPDVAAISFTGSAPVGDIIHAKASARHARVQLEMGGKNPIIVLDDADPSTAARIVATSGFGLTGQACTAASRAVCTPRIKDAFIAALIAETKRFQPGDGQEAATLMGPVVSGEQLATDRRYLTLAAEQGADVATGAEPPRGLYQDPAIVLGARPEHHIAQEEVFGPVVTILDADDLDTAIDIANDVPYGLAAGIVTTSLSAAHQFADRIQAGVVKVNRPTTGLDLNVPFGGVKASSSNTFREQGSVAVDFYTWSKSVYLGVD